MTSSADSLLESVFSLYLKKETRCVVGVIFIFICIHVCFLFVFCCVARLAYQSKNHMCCISNPSSIEMYVKYWLFEENVYWVWCEDIFLIVKQCKKTKKIKKAQCWLSSYTLYIIISWLDIVVDIPVLKIIYSCTCGR